MTWVTAIGYILKFAGDVLTLLQQGKLTQEALDAAVNALHSVPPPRGAV